MRMNDSHVGCEEKEQSKLYKIGMFAAMNHVTIKALRYYDEQGLLSPAYVDRENGYRYYTLSQS
ncbi:MAG: MerR family DNA-binding transcriptional regulator, partial [Lachnospiraceae bacterium]